eukprot:6457855-Amphidinium_carterae.1
MVPHSSSCTHHTLELPSSLGHKCSAVIVAGTDEETETQTRKLLNSRPLMPSNVTFSKASFNSRPFMSSAAVCSQSSLNTSTGKTEATMLL